MGNCPQANILFNNLTCEEVLEAFCNLGGVPPEQIPVQVDHLLRSVDIIGKRNEVALKLSGGNQRRLYTFDFHVFATISLILNW